MDILAVGNSNANSPFLPTTYQAFTRAELRDSFSGLWGIDFEVANLPIGLWHGGIAWADYDGDGDLDAVTTGANGTSEPYAGTTVLLVNNGSQLEPSAVTLPGLYGSAASWSDFDGDGDLDLLLIGAQSSDQFQTLLLRNDGGAFVEFDTSLPDLAFGDIAWTDFDLDGDADVLLSGATSDGTFVTDVFINTDNEFSPLGAQLSQPAFSSADWGDFDGDGDPDLLLSGGEISPLIFDGLLHIYRNDAGTLTLHEELVPSFYGEARWGDYDSDGDPDILAAGAEGAVGDKAVRIYANEGASGFVERIFLTGLAFASADFSDYDGDLDPDVLVTGLDRERSTILGLYRNDYRVPNTAPSAPSNLQSSLASGVLTLTWDAATDEQSGQGSLTYNVRVGTTSGGDDVLPSTTVAGGHRRLVSDRGNTGESTRLLLNLPNGSYFWSVQAIDAGFAASEFAAEGSVNVTGKDTSTDTEENADGQAFALDEPYPNPAAGAVVIPYSLDEINPDTAPAIAVFDARGAVVSRALLPARSGTGEWRWEPQVAAGLYFVKLTAGAESAVTKLVIVR